VPLQFLIMLPYVLTILVLAGFAGRSGAPNALGRPLPRR
jgi:general nucleoside transport system permease protein